MHRFDPSKHIRRLESPGRYLRQPPEFIVPYLPEAGEGPIVELGCGTGFFGRVLARYSGRFSYIGLDPSPELLDVFSSSLSSVEHQSILLVRSEKEKLPLKSASVPLMVMANVLHEIFSDSGIIPEIARVIAPSGYLFIVDWKKRPSLTGPPFTLRISHRKARRVFREAGFHQTASPPAYSRHYCLLMQKDISIQS